MAKSGAPPAAATAATTTDSPAPPRTTSDEMPAGAAAKMPAEEVERIVALYAKLNRMDHYHLLGVAATDDAKAIKRAYYAKAKEHHPDRWFRRDVGAHRAKIDAIFARLAAAEKTLCNAKERAAYDVYLREVLKTRMHRRQAEGLEADKKWSAAAEVWARIVEKLSTDAYVQHRYAYALLRAGTGFEVAMAAATRAIELDSTRAEYRVTAASLHLAEGRDRSALAQLSIACEIEPDRGDIAALHAALTQRVSRTR